ncbi:MAG TPA: TIGR01777 family oxidoreductase [Candidatus Binatia bacterium]|jgi:hypothetical protein
MKLIVAGGTGFIGSALSARLTGQGHSLILLTRSISSAAESSNTTTILWQPALSGAWEHILEEAVAEADGVINLAGEPIAAKRWSDAQKTKLRSSRIDTTRALVTAIGKAKKKPAFFINASAVGYYGPRADEVITEESGHGGDFLAAVCSEWEEEARKAEAHGVRVIRLRTGIVLGKGGGALSKMIPPFKLFIGGPLGSGKQWMPWVHIEDEIGLIQFLMENNSARGAVNACAPNPVTMKEFSRTLSRVLHRPCWAPVPAFALHLLLGEMADMLLTGQRVMPAAAQKLGYRFRHPELREAIEALLR